MEGNYSAAFVDAMREDLISRVSCVMPVADYLLQRYHIGQETYAEIRAATTNQKKMREIYQSLNNQDSKVAFCEALKHHELYLLRELELKFKSSGSYKSADTQVRHSLTAGSANSPNETCRVLNEKWQKNGNKYRSKFEALLKDPGLKSLGNGKLFMRATNDYQIGSGADGTCVYIGMRDDGTEVAVKRLINDNYKQLKDEMNFLRDPKLEHKNIVKYIDCTEDESFVYLCLQLCECNFEEYKKTKELDQDALKKVTKEVLLGLEVLHDARIIHRDIKPTNILIDVDGNARLADFGISRKISQGASTVRTARAGTRGWEAAEILNAEGTCGYKISADIQVCGMLVYYILSAGDHPFGKQSEVEKNIQDGKYHLDETTDVEAKDLIEKMLETKPDERLSAKEAVAHPYFWDDNGRAAFLNIVGDNKAVQKWKNTEPKLCEALKKYEKFTGWKAKITDLDDKFEKNLPNDLHGLLRCLRNRLVHKREKFFKNKMCKDLFPEFYFSANQLAKEMGWKQQYA